ncbi:MAG: DUF1269 domain-containing protein [Thermomicrobiales bacterium]|nr:DUF1269 domain-containing protein [Thermomicrobiales bacterium]
MATSLTAWKFDTVGAAKQAENALIDLSNMGQIEIEDAAVIEWESGKKKPKTRHLTHPNWKSAGYGGLLGLVLGLIFFTPLLGVAIGAGVGALWSHFKEYGIKREFVDDVKSQIVPGTSALFVLASSNSRDLVIEEIRKRGLNPTLIQSDLSDEEEQALRSAFAD